MRPWTPESVFAELAGWRSDPLAGWTSFAGVLRRRAGALGVACLGPILVVAVLAPLLAPTDPALVTGPSLQHPSAGHWMGTDALGRDLFSGVIHGARATLLVAGTVGGLALLIGAVVGLLAGYAGGRVDDILMRVTELFQVIPRFFLAIMAIALFGPGMDRVILVLGITSWPLLARVVRADVLVLKEQDFVLASRAAGASGGRIVVRELLPNVLPGALVVLGLLIGQVMLVEASLGFLGLGDPNVITWGSLAGQATPFLRTAWWLTFFPGVAIGVAVLGCNLLADAATDALQGDP